MNEFINYTLVIAWRIILVISMLIGYFVIFFGGIWFVSIFLKLSENVFQRIPKLPKRMTQLLRIISWIIILPFYALLLFVATHDLLAAVVSFLLLVFIFGGLKAIADIFTKSPTLHP